MDPIGIHEDENKEAYQCTYCEETFTDQNFLKVHLLSHKEYQNLKRIFQGQENYSEEDKYDELFDSIADKIDIHNEIKEETDEDSVMGKNENKEIKKASEDKIHKCKHCEKTFTEDRNMKRHIQTVHEGIRDFKCDECQMTFGLKQVLQRHIQSSGHKSQIEENCCDKCQKTFTTKLSLKRHIDVIHEGKKENICQYCGKAYGYINHLVSHQKNIHENKTNHHCKICGKSFGLLSNMKKHIYCLHEDHPDSKCEVCGRTFYNKKMLQQHILTVHEGRRDHVCESCGKAYANKSRLKEHFTAVHEGQFYQCESCGKSYEVMKSLKDHIKKVHQSSFECKKCGETFPTRLDLKNHKYARHMECESCGKKFEGPNAQATLRVHINGVHLGKRNYICHTCGKAFGSKNDMTRHVDSVHLKKQIWKDIRKNYPNGKKPPIINHCKYCEETFSHSVFMRKHIYDKHKEIYMKSLKKYNCEKCTRSWFARGLYFKHMNTKHESDSYECKFCIKSFTLSWDIVKERATSNPITYKCYKNKKCHSCENQSF